MGATTRVERRLAALAAASTSLCFTAGCGLFNVATCSKSEDGLSRTESLGPHGGVIIGPDDSMIDVPEGALDRTTALTITQEPDDAPGLPAGFTPAGYVWEFTPHGQEFAVPVTIRVPALEAITDVMRLFTAPPGGPWIAVPDATDDGEALSVQVEHFSYFVVGIPVTNCGDGSCDDAETASSCPDDCGVSDMALGYDHSCAIRVDGTLLCWGLNDSGQLGDGTRVSSARPVLVEALSGVVDVGVGRIATCAVLVDGDVWCFGEGAVSSASCLPGDICPDPVRKEGASGRIAVEAGSDHFCALSGVAVSCWGANGVGQLGIGDNTDNDTPTAVSGLASPVQLSSLSATTCALSDAGEVACWGAGLSGQLTTGADGNAPVAIGGLDPVDIVATGGQHVCALRPTGDVWCWGRNDLGQVGDADTSDHLTPTAVLGLTGTADLCAGAQHTCTIIEGGGVVCWGGNQHGQLGNGTYDDSHQPVEVTDIIGATAVFCGEYHTCAVLGDATAWCWGLNDQDQIGDPDTGYRTNVPVEVDL
jgi:alpha-tubulin suppressor-like RCC1 family protein